MAEWARSFSYRIDTGLTKWQRPRWRGGSRIAGTLQPGRQCQRHRPLQEPRQVHLQLLRPHSLTGFSASTLLTKLSTTACGLWTCGLWITTRNWHSGSAQRLQPCIMHVLMCLSPSIHMHCKYLFSFSQRFLLCAFWLMK
jgi:hypothetical protein